MSSIECPICYNDVTNYVNFDCCHKVCLECYFKQMLHSLNKCSLCRKDIIGMDESIYYIKVTNWNKKRDELIDDILELEEQVEILENNNVKLEEKVDELQEAQYLMIGNCMEY